MTHTNSLLKKISITFLWFIVSQLFQIHAQQLSTIMNSYDNYDMNSDGIIEIDNLTYLPFERASERLQPNSKLVLVLVEDRLLKPISGSSDTKDDLLEQLLLYKDKLRAEGFVPKFIKANIYSGQQHQDGQTLLAIRDFLKKVKQSKNLKGVILIGAFPEAMLVRRWIWKRENAKITIAGTTYDNANKTDFLRIVPEIVAHRADLVLADLDGNWENIYVRGPKNLSAIEAIPAVGTPRNWPINNNVFTSTKFNDKTSTFEDFFWIRDDNFQRLPSASGTLKLRLQTTQRHPELNRSDKRNSNPIASPDILVSRINAKNVGVAPDKNIVDSNNKGLLDTNGYPRTVVTSQNRNPKFFLKKDPATERALLINYFKRNLNYRSGGNPLQSHRTAATNFGSGLISASNLNTYLKKASSSFRNSVSFNNVNLMEYVNFLKTPASLKGMSSHSDPWGSTYGNNYTSSALEHKVGGKPWLWIKESLGNKYRYTPSLSTINGKADAYIHRTIYENEILKNAGNALFIHNGCEVNSPANASKVPYNHKDYGTSTGLQNAESILFFLNGVALASRAKVFYDKPEGFTKELGKHERNRFGDGWKAYFTKEKNDAALANKVASNKRTYTWSIIGDWTLRTQYDNGLGILKLKTSKLHDLNTHATKSWFGGWNFDHNLNKIQGKGDFNGDGVDDLLITSSWGIGVISRPNSQWQNIVAKPKNTWFGQWRYNASANTGTDKIEAIADFDGDGKDEILITSSWGIGILKLQGNTFRSIVTKPNGTRFGRWTYNTTSVRDNRIEGVGDFNNDGKTDILISKPYGIAILTLTGTSLNALLIKPKNTWFGQWRYNASINRGKDKIEAIADFNRDGKDDILITSSWGIGILKLQGNTFQSILAKPNGTRFGTWTYNTSSVRDNSVAGVGDFNGDGQQDILMTKPYGIGLLTLSGNSLRDIVVKPKNTWFGHWRYNATVNRGKDKIEAIADFNNDGNDDILIRSDWGTGVLKLRGNTFTTLTTHPNGSQLGAWHLSKTNKMPIIGNFDGVSGNEILVYK